jgi:hypothetical protein
MMMIAVSMITTKRGRPDSDDNGVTDCCHTSSANSKQAAKIIHTLLEIQEFSVKFKADGAERWSAAGPDVYVRTRMIRLPVPAVPSNKSSTFPHSPLRAAASLS